MGLRTGIGVLVLLGGGVPVGAFVTVASGVGDAGANSGSVSIGVAVASGSIVGSAGTVTSLSGVVVGTIDSSSTNEAGNCSSVTFGVTSKRVCLPNALGVGVVAPPLHPISHTKLTSNNHRLQFFTKIRLHPPET